ncbi:MAG: murein biosynthesis integral membrane protein MurJ [Puniceicoccaceae bacterium]
MHKNWINIVTVSGLTFLSRILGLARDGLLYAILGSSKVHAAFIIAFTLPNLFRRLLGEGALSSAAMPVLAQAQNSGGFDSMGSLLSKLCLRLAVALLVIFLVGELVFFLGLLLTPPDHRLHLAFAYSTVVFAYILPVCLAALLTAGLNLLGAFAVPAFTPVLLNLAIILGAFISILWLPSNPAGEVSQTAGWILCGSVLIGGLLQLGATFFDIWRRGWRFRFDFNKDSYTEKVWNLFVPGFWGAAVAQINLLVGRMLGFAIGSATVTYLYLATRLIELPLGLYAIAITTVYFPALSRSAASNDLLGVRRSFNQGLGRILLITLPAAAGLAALSTPILTTLFQHGIFSPDDVLVTAELLSIYALALPAYAVATFTIKGLHAVSNMRAPLKIATWNFFVHLAFCLFLIGPLGAHGLAAASAIASTIQAILLLRALHRSLKLPGEQQTIPLFPLSKTLVFTGTSLILFLALRLFALPSLQPASPFHSFADRLQLAFDLFFFIGLGALSYFAIILPYIFALRTKKSRSLENGSA